MTVTVCTPFPTGSANPAVTAVFKDTYGSPVAVEGVKAIVTDKYGSVITTVTWGTYSPEEATDIFQTSIVENFDSKGFHYELINLPLFTEEVIPDGFISVRWIAQDSGATPADVWKMYTFSPPVGVPKVKSVLTWAQHKNAIGYRVTWLDVEGIVNILGYTPIASFVVDAPSSAVSTFSLPGDDGLSTWDLSVWKTNGSLSTVVTSETTAVDPVYLLAEDDTIWSLEVEVPTGNLVTTLVGTEETTEDIYLTGPGGVSWLVELLADGSIVTTSVTGTLPLGSCDVTFVVDALGPCHESDSDEYTVLEQYIGNTLTVVTTTKDICIVTGTLLDVAGTARPVHRVNFHLYYCDDDQIVQNALLHQNVEVDAPVDANGCFSIPLMQGALVTCEIPSAGYAKRFVVPAQPQVDLSQIDGLNVELRRGE